MVDRFGNELKPGDTICYPVRSGSSASLHIAVVVSADEKLKVIPITYGSVSDRVATLNGSDHTINIRSVPVLEEKWKKLINEALLKAFIKKNDNKKVQKI